MTVLVRSRNVWASKSYHILVLPLFATTLLIHLVALKGTVSPLVPGEVIAALFPTLQEH